MFLYSLATTLKLLGVISFVNVLPNVTFLSRRDILRHRQGRTIIKNMFHNSPFSVYSKYFQVNIWFLFQQRT